MLVGFALSAGALVFVFHDQDFSEIKATWQRIEILPLVGSMTLYWLGFIVIRAMLIRHLLKSNGSITVSKAYRYICVGFLSNNILPARMGEIVRTAGIARAANVPFPTALGSLAVERVLDLFASAVIALVALLVAPIPDEVRLWIFIGGGTLFAVFVVLVLMARKGLSAKSEGDDGKKKIGVLIWNLIVRFTEGFKSLATTRGMLGALVLWAALWGSLIAVMTLRLASFGLPYSVSMALVLIPALSVGVSVPSAPAYVGVYHAAAVGALVLFGVDNTVAAGFAIFCHLVDIIPSCILGAIFMFLEGLGFADLKGRRGEQS